MATDISNPLTNTETLLLNLISSGIFNEVPNLLELPGESKKTLGLNVNKFGFETYILFFSNLLYSRKSCRNSVLSQEL